LITLIGVVGLPIIARSVVGYSGPHFTQANKNFSEFQSTEESCYGNFFNNANSRVFHFYEVQCHTGNDQKNSNNLESKERLYFGLTAKN
jgi:hypothetical protein